MTLRNYTNRVKQAILHNHYQYANPEKINIYLTYLKKTFNSVLLYSDILAR